PRPPGPAAGIRPASISFRNAGSAGVVGNATSRHRRADTRQCGHTQGGGVMRAPAASFKSELSAARRQPVSAIADGPDLRHALEVIDRWDKHPSAEDIWNTLQQKLPAGVLPSATYFIGLVLERSAIAKHLDGVIKEAPALMARARQQGERRWRQGHY